MYMYMYLMLMFETALFVGRNDRTQFNTKVEHSMWSKKSMDNCTEEIRKTKCFLLKVIAKGFMLGWQAQVDIDEDLKDECSNVRTESVMKLMELTKLACHKLQLLNSSISREKRGGRRGTLCHYKFPRWWKTLFQHVIRIVS